MQDSNPDVPDLDQAICTIDGVDRCVANPTLTLTAYLDRPLEWAQTHLHTVMSAFVDAVGADAAPWYLTSLSTEWLRLRLEEIEQLLQDPTLRWTRSVVRNHFWIRLHDATDAPQCGIYYRELDPAKVSRAGYLQIFLPLETHPDVLLQLALEIANTGAVLSLVGGYGYSFLDGDYKATAFAAFHNYAKRYLGIDIQDPDQMAWHARTHVPGANWLTLVSDVVLNEAGVSRDTLLALDGRQGVRAMALPTSVLLRAGDAPHAGDRNMLVLPDAYAEVALTLAPHFPTELEFWGPFAEGGKTETWIRRFADPAGWA